MTQAAITESSAPIILHGNNLDQNRGCQALRHTTLMMLDKHLPNTPRLHANLFCNDDPQFHQILPDPKSAGVRYEIKDRKHPLLYLWGAKLVGSAMLGLFPPMNIHKDIPKCRCLLAMGGDNLSFDYGMLATLLFFSPFAKAVKLGVPSVIWGASIGPFRQKPAWEKRFADILKQVDLITAREPLTQAYLAELGIEHNVRMVSDPAFLLPAEQPELPAPLDKALNDGALGLNLAPLMIRYSGQSKEAWSHAAVEMLANVARRIDMPIVLIPHVMQLPNFDPINDDFAFMKGLWESLELPIRERVFLYDAREHTSMQIKGVISRLRAFAGNRTHATIAALSTHVPTFSIGYSVKSRGINQDIFGHENWVAHFSQLKGQRLAERIENLLREGDGIRKHLQGVIPAYAEKAWLNGVYLSEMLARGGG
ncbi:MAG: polysaccharide pyruvyl transferase family protein [Planctomycetaceae bacterium]|nr:polysaccharide pyruvyl transferase family protein [Planctomycetaceae bacterium]